MDLARLAIRTRESRDVRHVIDVLSRETAHVTDPVRLRQEPRQLSEAVPEVYSDAVS